MRALFNREIDELGEGLIRQYLGVDADRTYCVDIEGFVTDFLKLPLLYRTFAEQDTDKIGFISDGVTPLHVFENGKRTERIYEKGTVVIERCLRQVYESGRRRFTISHESAHYVMDRTVPYAAFHREYDSGRNYGKEDFRALFNFKETRIDRMGAALLMPGFMVRNVLLKHGCPEGIAIFGDNVLRAYDKLLIKDMANTMGVSFSAILIRLKELELFENRPLSEYITNEMGLGRECKLR